MAGINRIPIGLHNLLQYQAGGKNPDQVSETVSPVIDLEPYYLINRQRAQIVEEPAFGILNAIKFEVPDGELWRINSVSCSTLSLDEPTDELLVTIGIVGIPGAGETYVIQQVLRLQGVAGGPAGANIVAAGGILPTPLFLAAGQTIQINKGAPSTGAIDLTAFLSYWVYQVSNIS